MNRSLWAVRASRTTSAYKRRSWAATSRASRASAAAAMSLHSNSRGVKCAARACMVNSAACFLNSVTEYSTNSLSSASECELRGTTIGVSVSYVCSHALVRVCGTATSSVVRYSLAGTKSVFLSSGARERVERLPLGAGASAGCGGRSEEGGGTFVCAVPRPAWF